jgi:transposase
MRALRAGERDPVPRAPLRQERCQPDAATMAKALHGHGRAAPRFALAQAVALDDLAHQQLSACDRQLEAPLATCAERRASEAWPPLARPRQRTRHRPRVDVRGARPRMPGVDRTASAGLDAPTALTISSEIGRDRGRGPTVQPCTSWRGRCPHPQVAGGTVFSRSTKPWANRAATALRLAASGLPRRQRARGAFCRRLKARLGTPHASTATAHQLARLISMLLNHGTADVRQHMADSARQHHNRMVQTWTRRATACGEA